MNMQRRSTGYTRERDNSINRKNSSNNDSDLLDKYIQKLSIVLEENKIFANRIVYSDLFQNIFV